ncbi:MAG: hypothetical protein ACTSX8_10440 [Alphaproteobacteria bacterium]
MTKKFPSQVFSLLQSQFRRWGDWHLKNGERIGVSSVRYQKPLPKLQVSAMTPFWQIHTPAMPWHSRESPPVFTTAINLEPPGHIDEREGYPPLVPPNIDFKIIEVSDNDE